MYIGKSLPVVHSILCDDREDEDLIIMKRFETLYAWDHLEDK